MLKLLKNLFTKKSNGIKQYVSGSLLKINEVLTTEQERRVLLFYNEHRKYIDKLVSETEKAYEPSQGEDKNNPMIWKAEYWKWFLANCH